MSEDDIKEEKEVIADVEEKFKKVLGVDEKYKQILKEVKIDLIEL